jgi:hypothetical protein
MSRARKYGKYAMLLVVLLLAAQTCVSLVVRTQRMRGYLIAHLEKTFGRPVQADNFSVQIFPMPELDVDGVTIGEDPSFGTEYFLRAERMAARLRWSGLVRGRFEFGTMALTKPSLILVRNDSGKWNLEGWLPPAKQKSEAGVSGYGPMQARAPGNSLEKIEIDEGRINFKVGAEKKAFSFINVSGRVEQTGPGRWELQLEAQPWRSGLALQSTGTLRVEGDVAGTSARLQPAQIQVHWGKASLADVFRLATGNDSGVRGEFSLDGNASAGKNGADGTDGVGKWKFDLQARAEQVHRWDLPERDDNPQVTMALKGLWDLVAGEAHAEELTLTLPHSNFTGTAMLSTPGIVAGLAGWTAHVDKAELQLQDALAWYRAFSPGVAERVTAEQFYEGSFTVRGWPVRVEDAQWSSSAGVLRIPELGETIAIDAMHAQEHGTRIDVAPFRVSQVKTKLGERSTEISERTPAAGVGASPNSTSPNSTSPNSSGLNTSLSNTVFLRFSADRSATDCALGIGLHLGEAQDLFKTVAAFGKTLNRGWELSGGATGALEWKWARGAGHKRWNGSVTLAKAQVQVAGLNLPLKLDDLRVDWKDGRRSVTLSRVGAFGATWTGNIDEVGPEISSDDHQWRFQLHADRLDAAELDRWIGPRARPNWLQRLLPSLLAADSSNAKASELLRRVSADGEISADNLTIEKMKLAHVHARVEFRDLHLQAQDAEAQWAGGAIRGNLKALFSATPEYEITAEVDRVNLAQLPWSANWDERWNGAVSGNVHLTTSGVGREELLRELTGGGELNLKTVEFRGWDVGSSLGAGGVRTGNSRWASGEGIFTVKDRVVKLEDWRLDEPAERTELSGTLGFAQDARLTFRSGGNKGHGNKAAGDGRVLEVSGPMELLKASMTTGEKVNP